MLLSTSGICEVAAGEEVWDGCQRGDPEAARPTMSSKRLQHLRIPRLDGAEAPYNDGSGI